MGEIEGRKQYSQTTLTQLRNKLDSAASLVSGKACVYATGSFGRSEASKHSDLDLFILAKPVHEPNGNNGSLLTRLDEICVKADLIESTRALKIPDFDGDGRYLTQYTVEELTKTLGTPQDDVSNTFTARLLLLLESTPLLEREVYGSAIDEVLAAYWRDYADHKADFAPAFLANDILRLWRTFCVNYEARTEREPEEKKAKGKIKNYKLKHSRMLTCYSALLNLLFIYGRDGTVSTVEALEMAKRSPLDRIVWLAEHIGRSENVCVRLLRKYEEFLELTNAPEEELINLFLDRDLSKKSMASAVQFGDLTFEAITEIGNGSRLHRMLVV